MTDIAQPVRIRVLIAEDDRQQADKLREAIAILRPDWSVVAIATTVAEALQAIEDTAPTLLLLDIHLPGSEDGRWIERLDPRLKVIFATGDPNFAVQAFDRAAIDYVLKPLTMRRLQVAFDRAAQDLGPSYPEQPEAPVAPPARLATAQSEGNGPDRESKVDDSEDPNDADDHEPLEWITVSRGQEFLVVPADEIVYVKADLKYTQVISEPGVGLARLSIGDMAHRLPGGQFVRIHRSAVVNRRFIESVRRDEFGHMEVRLKGVDEVLRVSKAFQYVFRIT